MITLDSKFLEYFISILVLYVPFYIVSTLYKEKYPWDCFTRIGSTINAFFCMSFVLENLSYEYYGYYYVGNDSLINSLYLFSAYLCADGLLQFPIKINVHEITSVLHHFVGGLGIYMMAERQIGLGLGLYFGATELSTPLMNLSWLLYTNGIKSKSVFGSMYINFFASRILTIPFLLKYLYINYHIILNSGWTNFILAYFGSSILILLNLTWFLMLTKKIIKS